MKNRELVKTIKFSDAKYIGDPINTVRIFNEKCVDELIILDISTTNQGKSPDYKMIERLASESQMPLCYGGGIRNVAQAKDIISLGIEKVSLSTAILENAKLVSEVADELGRQSVVAVLDVKYNTQKKIYEIYSTNGTVNTGRCPVELSKQLQDLGIGEIILNSIDNDGVMEGYDIKLAKEVYNNIHVPLTMIGGAGSLRDIATLVHHFGTIGAAAGSLFVFKGIHRAVLINYPNRDQKNKIFSSCYI